MFAIIAHDRAKNRIAGKKKTSHDSGIVDHDDSHRKIGHGVELSDNTADSILCAKKRKVILFLVVLD